METRGENLDREITIAVRLGILLRVVRHRVEIAQVCDVLTWFRGESFANRRDVPRSRCSLTLQLLSLRFTLVLLICGVVFCR